MILCVGLTPTVQRTMVFRQLAINGVNRAVEVVEGPSGKSVNVAKVLTAMGVEAVATGFLGGGDRGRFLVDGLDAMGVRHDFVTVGPRTRLCITVIDQSTGAHTEMVEESRRVEESAFDGLREKIRGLLGRANLLTMSGTLTPGAPAEFYGQCTRMAGKAGVRAIVDAQGEALMKALAARPMMVKPNRAELGHTLGTTLDTEAKVRDAIRRLIDLGAGSVVITMGGEGALASDGRAFWRVHPPKVQVLNTIGSGDSFTAGLAATLASGRTLADALRLGAACGAANAMTLLSGEVDRAVAEQLLGEVRVDEV